MTAAFPLILAVIAVISFTACAQEVAYAYGDFGRILESGNITEYNGTDIVTSAIASAGFDSRTLPQKSTTTADDMKREIDLKLNVGNPGVINKSCSLVLDYPGDGTISQICSIYEYMVANWSYKRDPRGIEVFQYSNQSLVYGNGKYSGQGDCDDFSILLASLIESIGCTSRIVLAHGPNGGHAYTEVYLGAAGGPESDVGRMIGWLKKKYKVNEINTHTDMKTGDVWLNLDWWKEPGGAKHPGGPLFNAANHILIFIREDASLAPLKPLNDLPVAQFTISPFPSIVGENASFDASESRDIGGRIDAYLWDFGDGNKTDKMSEPTVNHIYLKGGPCTVILIVEDDEGATSIISKNMTINNPPQANFTIMPQKPVVGDLVKFDASKSYDAEDGKSLAYHWEINNNSAIFSVVSPPRQVYDEGGMYWINLTVTDRNEANGYKNLLLKINKPPTPHIDFNENDLSAKKFIAFRAASSKDLDGKIISYAWDFGDNSPIDYNETALHSYETGGNETVKLTLKDNDGAVSSISQDIHINWPPTAKFSVDPQDPSKGEPVSFNASSSSDPDGRILEYSWDFGENKVEPDVYTSEFAMHTYYRPQKYNVTLTVEDDKGSTGSFSQLVEVKEIINNNNPIIISLQPDEKSPQETGSTIIWTVEVMGAENGPMQFQFSLDGQVVQDWSDSPVWSWTASNEMVGLHVIEAKVRDGMHNQDGNSANFEIVFPPNNAPGIKLPDLSRPPTDGNINTTQDAYAWYNKGLALNSAGKYDEAIKALDKAIEIDPNDATAWNIKGVALDNQGKHDEAIKALDKALEIDPNDAAALHNKGWALNNFGKYDEAIQALDKAIEIDPNDASNWNSKGYALDHQGKYVEAIQALDKALEIDPNDAVTWNTKGVALNHQGKYVEAIQASEKAIEIDPNYASAWNSKGYALDHQGKHVEAIQALDKALEIDPNFDAAWNIKGEALNNLGRYDEAIQAFDKAIEINPKYILAWNNKGLTLIYLGEYDEAIQAFDKALEIDPNDASAWINKVTALDHQGKHDGAILASEKAIEIDPNDASAWNSKGWALNNFGKYEEAIQALDKALEIDPNYATAWNNKGYALKLLERTTEADVAFAKAKKLGYTG